MWTYANFRLDASRLESDRGSGGNTDSDWDTYWRLAYCQLWYCDMIVMYSIFIPILLWTNGKWKTYLWILDFIQNSHCIAYIYIGYEKVLNGQPHLSPHLLESINSEDKTVKMRSSASVECGGSAQCCSPLLQPSEWFKDDKLIGFGSQELCSLSSLNNDQR